MASAHLFIQNGSQNITSDGVCTTEELSTTHSNYAHIEVAAFDSNGDIVETISAGTITVEAFGAFYGQVRSGESSGDNPIQLSECGNPAAYDSPTYIGPCSGARITIAGTDFATDGIEYLRVALVRERK